MKLLKLKPKDKKISFYHQLESSDCAAACLAMVASYHGIKPDLEQVKSLFEFTRIGVSIKDILLVSPKIGLNATALKVTLTDLQEIPLPAILYWKQGHFIVLEKVSLRKEKLYFKIADPSYGKTYIDEESFAREWKGANEKGVAIILSPADDFNQIQLPEAPKNNLFQSVFFKEAIQFLKNNKFKYILSIFLILLTITSNWLIPFIFQRLIDFGISAGEIHIVYSLLAAQLVLFLSSMMSNFLSNLILTKINFKLSVGLKNNLLYKIMRLPINYFDTRLNTETLQRMGDQNTIQNFITWKGIDFCLNILNIIIFSSILLYFNVSVFLIYAVLSVLSIGWTLLFLKKRAVLEYSMFLQQSENSNHVYEFIMNMPEIKTNNAQNHVVSKIISTIEKLNKLQLRSLFLNMYQNFGVGFINKLKKIIVIAICAVFIIRNEMTIDTLMSISYVIGQLAGPLSSLIGFIRVTQDTNIANKRIGEIYNKKDENDTKTKHIENQQVFNKIAVRNVSFKYPGSFSPFVLKDISFDIPKNEVTAIVGASGSGKTTFLKLLLSYYDPSIGEINLDNTNLKDIYPDEWRGRCGTVLQDGHLFSGTIIENIVFSSEEVCEERLLMATKIACIHDFILTLPMGYNTKIGNVGIQLSGGQRQRILIARAVYKNPHYIFFDEATSSLDAENERVIHDNLDEFFKGKTVLIIAHRLSTVKKANQIIVLKQGKIVEKGTHVELVAKHSEYFNLVKNQLELGE